MLSATRLAAAAFLAALLVLVGLAWATDVEINRLDRARLWSLHTREVLEKTDRIGQLLSDAQSAARGYAVSGDGRLAETQIAAANELPRSGSTLLQLVSDNPDQQQRVKVLMAAIQENLAHTSRIVQSGAKQGLEVAQALVRSGQGYTSMQRARELLGEIRAVEESLLGSRLKTEEEQGRSVRRVIALLGLAALVFLVLAWVFVARALTVLRQAQQLARHGEAKLFATLHSCGDAVIVTDEAGMVTLINPVAQGLTGWREDQAKGVPIDQVFRIVNEHTRSPVENPVGRVLREGKVVGLANHTVLLARDGAEWPVDDSGAPIKQSSGETIGVVLVFREVTARKLAEQQRERLVRAELERAAAVEANEAKDQFLAVVSHELRSPLAAIRGWLQVLMSGRLAGGDLQAALGRIFRNTRQQQRLIDDLLDISSIMAGKFEVIRSPVNLVALCETAVDERKWACEQKRIALHFHRLEDPLLVNGDEQRLVQSITNLIGNGIKFTSPPGSVSVTVQRVGDKARVQVMDTGMGMTEEVLNHLFERFWQADNSKTRRQGGLGLGLAITKHIVEAHEGTINATSDGPGTGSAFTLELPLIQNVNATAATAPGVANVDLDGVRILIVDDDVDSLDALALFLHMRGAVVRRASSVQEAMRAYQSEPPAVVLTDVSMPNEDGYSLTARIRAHEAHGTRRTTVIAITGMASPPDATKAQADPFDSYLTKPVNFDEVAAQIKVLLV